MRSASWEPSRSADYVGAVLGGPGRQGSPKYHPARIGRFSGLCEVAQRF